MSLGLAIKGPEGVVLAADSRVTLEAQRRGGPILPVNFDNATKLLSFSKPHCNVGAVTYGAAVIGQRTAYSFIPEFEVALKKQFLKGKKKEHALRVRDFSQILSKFYTERWKEVMPTDWKGPNMTFIVGGYDPDAAYGKIFLFEIPGRPTPELKNPGEKEFGMTWGGQLQIVSRIVHGFDPAVIDILCQTLKLNQQQANEIRKALKQNLEFPIPYSVLPLQDCVDLAIFLIRGTMTTQNLAIGMRGVGGSIDVAVITRTEGLQHIQKKIVHGEGG